MQTTSYIRKPFTVEAVRVTTENFDEVMNWCKGTAEYTADREKRPAEKFIKVDVRNPLSDRQTRAFVGDFVLFANNGFKVYTKKAFEGAFERPTPAAPEKIAELKEKFNPVVEKAKDPAKKLLTAIFTKVDESEHFEGPTKGYEGITQAVVDGIDSGSPDEPVKD